MNHSLFVSLVDGKEEHLAGVDLPQTLAVFDAIPWTKEVSAWLSLSTEAQEECRPVLSVYDDEGGAVHITAYSVEVIAITYQYPYTESDFGFASTDKQASLGTDQYPRSELSLLLSIFFEGDRKALVDLIQRYGGKPLAEESEC